MNLPRSNIVQSCTASLLETAMKAQRPRTRAAVFEIFGKESEAIEARFGRDSFSRHYHDTYSFGLVYEGVNQFGYRHRTFEAQAGTIGICDPGEVHDGGKAGIGWAYRSAFPSAGTMRDLAAELGMDGLPGFNTGHITDPLSIRRLDRFLRLLFSKDSGACATEVEEAAIDAFATIIERNADSVRPQHGPTVCSKIAQKALAVMHDRWSEPMSLSEIAQATGASRFSTIRSVARATGLTPHNYVVQLRVDRAKALIRSGASIAAAAVDAGFVDQSHLSRALARRWGVTPGAFRAAYRHRRSAI